MKTNTKKTKVIKEKRKIEIIRVELEENNMKITMDGEEIEQVSEFCYLGILTSDVAK